MSRSVPLSRVQRVQDVHSRSAALARALGSASGVRAEVGLADDKGVTSAELWLYGIVGGYWFGFNDRDVARQLAGLNVDHITVRLNSPGGDVVTGIAIGNLFRNHKATVTVVVDGLAASSASVIAIAGDDIVMSPGSQMMLHDPWMFTLGNEKELRQDADFIGKQAVNLAGVYATRGGKSAEEWRAVMTAEPDGTWFTADESVAEGLADRVGTVVAVGTAPEPPPVDMEDEDDDMAACAAWDLEVLIPPAARAAWNVQPQAGPKPPSAPASGSITQEGSPAVAFSDEQVTSMRQKLGVAEDADEATILAALDEALEEGAEATTANTSTTTTTAQVPEGMVLVESEVWETVRTGAEAGRKASQTLDDQTRDATIEAAIKAGKTTPARREHWVASWAADAEGTKQTLEALAPGLVPVEEIGDGDQPETTAQLPNIDDAVLEAFAAQFGLKKEDLRG